MKWVHQIQGLQTLGLASLGVLALIALYLNPLSSKDLEVSHSTPPEGIDAYMIQANAIAYHASGEISHHLSVDRWEHHTKAALTTLLSPTITWYEDDGVIVYLHAQRGVGDQATLGTPMDVIKLSDQVLIKKSRTHPKMELKLETQELTVRPKEHTSYTESPVTLYHDGSIVTAQGMNVDLSKQTIQLHGKVTTTYDTSQLAHAPS